MNIPIIVAAYNRPDCLSRLLKSLENAEYNTRVKLIISIDGGGTQDVLDIAAGFEWRHGEKEIIRHPENIGLRKHILFCGSQSLKYDGVVLLEDDLYVSPCYYSYLQKAAEFYADDDRISGIALYSPGYNETAMLPFTPLDDGRDVFFMQLACSWGQCWLKEHWADFMDWYAENDSLDLSQDAYLPPNILLWPDTSWKKYYIKYMMQKDKYFVYPRSGYSTNFGDAGQHHKGSNVFQIPLRMDSADYKMSEFDNSAVKYDAFCEMNPETLKMMRPELAGYDFETDLYGYKNIKSVSAEYLLTVKESSNPEMTFGMRMKPHEANIITGVKGEEICLSKTTALTNIENFIQCRLNRISDWKNVHMYYYPMTETHYLAFNCDIERLDARVAKMNKYYDENQKILNGTREKLTQAYKYIEELNSVKQSHEKIIGELDGNIRDFENKLHEAYKYQEVLLAHIAAIQNSLSFRIGSAIIYPFSVVKRLINKSRVKKR